MRRPSHSPGARSGHSMVYYPPTGHVMLFGGDQGSMPGNDLWEWNGIDWRMANPATAPPARSLHCMTYDQDRGVLLVFGGRNATGSPLNDLWEWSGTNWREVSPGSAPPPRYGAAADYDPVSKRLWVYGGAGGPGNWLTDTWTYDGYAWGRLQPQVSPSGVTDWASMAFDTTRSQLVLFQAGETWVYDASTWRQRDPSTRPSVTGRSPVVYDSNRGQLLTFACGSDISLGGPLGALWSWDGTDWHLASAPPAPSPREAVGMACDVLSQRIVLFGGMQQDYSLAGDTWTWNGATWSKMLPSTSPSPRRKPAMAYDSERNVVVLFGGEVNYETFLGETWEWNGTTWAERTVSTSPPPQSGHRMAYDSSRRLTVLVGCQPPGDTWEYDGSNWLHKAPATQPSAIGDFEVAYDPGRSKTVLFGGQGPTGALRETWEWDGSEWVRANPLAFPPAQANHAMAYDPVRHRIVVLGNDGLWEYDGTTWTHVELAENPWPGHAGLAFDSHRERLVLFGGGWDVSGTQNQATWELPSRAGPGPNQDPTVSSLLGPTASLVVGQSATFSAVATDPDGDLLTYTWSLRSQPLGSTAFFSLSTGISASFVPDRAGTYSVQVSAFDGYHWPARFDRLYTAQPALPTPPTILALSYSATTVTSATALPIRLTVTFDEPVKASPAPTAAFLKTAGTGTPPATLQLSPDSPGSSGTVFVGQFSPTFANNGSYSLTFTAIDVDDNLALQTQPTLGNAIAINLPPPPANRPPVAVARGPSDPAVGTRVVLNGTESSDPDGNALTYHWAITSSPSAAWLDNAYSPNPSFIPPVAGTYVCSLTVCDSAGACATAGVSVNVGAAANRPPTANPGPGLTTLVGWPVRLDGRGSFDPDNDGLAYSWAILAQPSGASATLTDATSSVATFRASWRGAYTLQLAVSDGHGGTDRASVTVTATGSGGYTQADMTGNWDAHSIASGPGAPWWLRATATVSASGSFSGNQIESDGETDTISGTLTIGDTGAVVFGDGMEGALDTSKNLAVFSETWQDWQDWQRGTADMMWLTRRAASYSQGDLTGTWRIHSLETGRNFAIWSRGTIQVAAGGTYTASFYDNTGDTDSDSGQMTLASDGTVNIPNTQEDNPLFKMSAGKDVILYTMNTEEGGSPVAELGVLTKQAASYSQSDLAGLWAYVGLEGWVGPQYCRGLVRIGPDGTFEGSGFDSVDGPWQETGRLTVAADGTVSDSSEPDGRAHLAAGKTLIVGTSTRDGDPRCVALFALLRVDSPGSGGQNRAPIASCGQALNALVGRTISLDGSASIDPDGNPLTYSWRVGLQPSGANVSLQGATTRQPSFVPPVAGTCVLTLTVSDGQATAEASVTVEASPAGSFTLTLTPGLNLVSLPLQPYSPSGVFTLEDLCRVTYSSFVATTEASASGKSRFKVHTCGLGADGAPQVQAAHGYVLSVRQAGTITLEGVPWPRQAADRPLSAGVNLIGLPCGVPNGYSVQELSQAVGGAAFVAMIEPGQTQRGLFDCYLPNLTTARPVSATRGYLVVSPDSRTASLPSGQVVTGTGGAALTASALTVSSALVAPGRTFTVSLLVRNTGSATATGVEAALAFSSSAANFTVTASPPTATVAAGTSQVFLFTVTVSPSTPLGSVNVWATVAGADSSSGQRLLALGLPVVVTIVSP
ncbi:MAG: PKD domain-containing protein [Candidatus Riflebacteria bacterium]|nr:PKD domain-containing protein [Candidatus Riflebacteria bacterium]